MSLFFPASLASPLERGCFAFLLLITYSLLGWCGEMVYCSIGQRRLCEKRGFLNGPLCPIYGHGALVVLLVLDGGCEHPALTFLLGALAKLHAIQRELAEKLDALRAEQQRAAEAQRQRLEEAVSAARQSAGERAALARQSVQARLEPLADLGDEFALRLEEAKNEAQQKLHALYQCQDFFERRLLRSFPALRSLRHGEALARWREYLARRKK